jgi:hypothetical protein
MLSNEIKELNEKCYTGPPWLKESLAEIKVSLKEINGRLRVLEKR